MTGYERYQLMWMLSHDYSLNDLANSMTQYQVDGCEGTVAEIFDEWEHDSGFGGEIWACDPEWEDCQDALTLKIEPNELIECIKACLPDNPAYPDWTIWENGDEILCKDAYVAERIATFIDYMCGGQIAHTGYYDPKEDEKEPRGPFKTTGWHYVDFD